MLDPGSGGQAGQEKRVDLVMEGGGVKGNALVGALAVLEERGYLPQNVAGTSAGAIVATALAAGYTAQEQRAIIQELNFSQFTDTAWEDRVPGVGKLASILKDQGVYEGDRFFEWMRALLEAKGVRTFRDLVQPAYADEPQFRYKVRVIASDLTGRCLLALPQDAVKLGLEPDDLNVALAVRMSMSIPLFFEPVRVKNLRTGRDHVIVDGGLLSNYPLWLFDAEGEPAWPTFGLRLVEGDPKNPDTEALPGVDTSASPVQVTIDFLRSLVATVLQAHDRLYIEQANFARTIPIPTLGVSGTDFNLSRAQANALYEAGRKAAEEFLATWDFEAYVAQFRSGKTVSRRAQLVEQMRQAAEA
jgi:NTE family protein